MKFRKIWGLFVLHLLLPTRGTISNDIVFKLIQKGPTSATVMAGKSARFPLGGIILRFHKACANFFNRFDWEFGIEEWRGSLV